MEENKKESFLGFIIIVVAIILLGVGIGLLIVMPNESGFGTDKSNNNNSNNTENTNVENTEINGNQEIDNPPTPSNIEVDVDKLINPFLIFSKCGGPNYLSDNMNYDSLSDGVKLEIAYTNIISSYEQSFNASDLLESYKQVFGSDKTIELPDSLQINHSFASYSKEGDQYVLQAQGGGCTGIGEFVTRVRLESKTTEKVVIKVDYGFITQASEDANFDDYDNIECVFYNSLNKERVVKDGFVYGNKDAIVSEVFDNNLDDYILYTFKVENDHYVFESASIVKK